MAFSTEIVRRMGGYPPESRRREDLLLGLERRDHALPGCSARPYSRCKISTPFPIMPIDQIHAGPAWKSVNVSGGPKFGSDHLPIIAAPTR